MDQSKFTFAFLGRSGRTHFGYSLSVLFCCFSLFLIFQLVYGNFLGSLVSSEKSNIHLLINLIPFAIFLFLLLFFSSLFHKRSLKSFITGQDSFKFKRLVFCFIYWIVFNSLVDLFNYFFFQQNYDWNFDANQFLVLVAICFSFLIIQSATEEVFIRGYLLQTIVAQTNKLWLGILVSSLIFLILHHSNPENNEYGYWTMSAFYFSSGIILAVLAILGNGLEIVIGIHAANNFYTAVIVNTDSSVLQTASLFNTKITSIWPMICFNILAYLILYFILRKLKWIVNISYLIKFNANDVVSA